MADSLSGVATSKLRHWAHLLAQGALNPPLTAAALELPPHGPETSGQVAAVGILLDEAGSGRGAAVTLRWLAEERDRSEELQQGRIQLVWSGPEGQSARHRDTAVVVRELFSRAEREVLVAGFSVAQGQMVFRALADRLVARPKLRITLCVNIGSNSTAPPDIAAEVADFMEKFWQDQWPWQPRVPVYFDPRGLAPARADRAAMHAKVIVVDRTWALVTSANFTSQGQHRNIEAGILLKDAHVSRQLADEFGALIKVGALQLARS